MKKPRRLLLAVMIVVAGAATIFVGCKKEKDEAKYYTEAGSVSKEDDMSAYLKQFKEKMQSATIQALTNKL